MMCERLASVWVSWWKQPILEVEAALVHFSELEDLERLRNQSSQDGLGGLLHKWEDADDFTLTLDAIERSSSPTLPEPG